MPGTRRNNGLFFAMVIAAAFAGCRSHNAISLDPLKDKDNLAASDPLKSGTPASPAGTKPVGQARLLTPELGPGNEKMADSSSPTLGGPAIAALASNSRVSLENPKGPSGTSSTSSNKQATWKPSGGSLTLDQAKEQLKARGVTWQNLEMGADGLWHFRCTVPNPENPTLSRVYETSDTSDLGAVRKALAIIGS